MFLLFSDEIPFDVAILRLRNKLVFTKYVKKMPEIKKKLLNDGHELEEFPEIGADCKAVSNKFSVKK